MNGFERITAALELREPDRIPTMEWSIHPSIMEALCPGSDLFDFVERMDLDGIAVGGGHRPEHADTAAKTYLDKWGVLWGRTAEAFHSIEGPIKSEADLRAYSPPSPYDDDLLTGLRRAVECFKGKRFIVYNARAEFTSAAELRGYPELLMDFVDNPKLAHGVLKVISDYYCIVVRRVIEAGADAVMFGDDWAFNTSPFMSPGQFREFILPYFKRVIQACKDAGGYVWKHCDGNIWPIIDMVVEAGIDAINPIQPDAGMDLGEVKRKYGQRICVSGNIDCGYTLSTASVDQVVRETKEAIRVAGPGGGYVLMSSNSIHSSVKPENYRAMVETTRAFGKYPL